MELKRNMLDYNVIFITLDCCRYDTAVQANLPFLKQLGSLREAETYATYTLPAHISFFAGYLPKVTEEPYEDFYSRGSKQLWRLKSARAKDPELVGLFLEGANIFEGYRKLGYYTLGTGGVRWFRNKTLIQPFNEFLFYGHNDYEDVFTSRKIEHFALEHIEEIKNKLMYHENWFLFINAQETHVPYDIGYNDSNEVYEILKRAKSVWGGKKRNLLNNITSEEFGLLHKAQIRALEEVDRRIERLIDVLPGKKIVVVCGDHGEAFGEEGMYGHGFPAPSVYKVPLIVGFLGESGLDN